MAIRKLTRNQAMLDAIRALLDLAPLYGDPGKRDRKRYGFNVSAGRVVSGDDLKIPEHEEARPGV